MCEKGNSDIPILRTACVVSVWSCDPYQEVESQLACFQSVEAADESNRSKTRNNQRSVWVLLTYCLYRLFIFIYPSCAFALQLGGSLMCPSAWWEDDLNSSGELTCVLQQEISPGLVLTGFHWFVRVLSESSGPCWILEAIRSSWGTLTLDSSVESSWRGSINRTNQMDSDGFPVIELDRSSELGFSFSAAD